MTKIKTVYYFVITILTIVFLALAAYILAGAFIAKQNNEPFSYFGHSAHYVTTDSMSPDINIGDIAIIKKIDLNKVVVGDDVLYYAPDGEMKGKLILHRVKGINNDGSLITHAIKSGAIDDPYSVDNIVGVKATTSKALGKMYIMFTTPSGIILMAIIIISIVVIGKCVVNIAKTRKS